MRSGTAALETRTWVVAILLLATVLIALAALGSASAVIAGVTYTGAG